MHNIIFFILGNLLSLNHNKRVTALRVSLSTICVCDHTDTDQLTVTGVGSVVMIM